MCFSPQRRTIFQQQNVKKCSEDYSFLTFWLPHVRFATAVCHFSTSERTKVLQTPHVLNIFVSTFAFRHSSVHFFSTAEDQKVLRSWRVLYAYARATVAIIFFCGAVRARSSDGHQSICKDCPFPRMRKSETIPKVSLETKATSNKQKQHKTATNHKQQTNNPGHLAKKVKHYAFRSIPLSLSTAPRRNSNITHSHPTCSKVIITCDDDTSRIEPLLNVVVYATHCNHLDKTSYHRQHPE